ncbi:MAG: flagellar assembly peptidoglycan hydrolase FlgJ [Pseudomonadota bacterium]
MTASITTATEFSQYAGLRAAANNNDPAALREVAGQFEALFMQTMLKNMRAGQLAEPLFGSEQHKMYVEMMDQQFAIEMASGRGLGFAEMLVNQLGGAPMTGTGTASTPRSLLAVAPVNAPARSHDSVVSGPDSWRDASHFAADLWPHASRAANRLGVAPEAILAQAALETGWGEHVMRFKDGSNSNNLFGIKADSDWGGGSVVRQTLEVTGGVPEVVRARFRAYPNLEATFADYTRLLAEQPRYQAVTGSDDVASFANALQEAGYATDPRYAEKIMRIAGGETLKEALRGLKETGSPPMLSNQPDYSAR